MKYMVIIHAVKYPCDTPEQALALAALFVGLGIGVHIWPMPI